jgi:hypothetical protein
VGLRTVVPRAWAGFLGGKAGRPARGSLNPQHVEFAYLAAALRTASLSLAHRGDVNADLRSIKPLAGGPTCRTCGQLLARRSF